MATETVMADLRDLQPLADKLNSSIDEVNAIIQRFQDNLNRTKIGVEAWLENAPLTEEVRRDLSSNSERYVAYQQLGYARLDDGWALCVRHALYRLTRDELNPTNWIWADQEPEEAGAPEPLLRASRAARLAAIALIPRLMDVIQEQASEIIKSIEHAKKIADSLN
jgi:hypothetical protein